MDTKFIEHLRGGHQVYKTLGIISNTLDDLAQLGVMMAHYRNVVTHCKNYMGTWWLIVVMLWLIVGMYGSLWEHRGSMLGCCGSLLRCMDHCGNMVAHCGDVVCGNGNYKSC